jgi:hypothetical protein
MINDRDDQQFTTVKQWYGQVTVEAEVQNVQHFAVRTPQLAAVVKGTRFVVSSADGQSSVDVLRGHVEVDDARRDYTVTVAAGQSVTTGDDTVMQVSGSGELPAVVTAAGTSVDPALVASPRPQAGHLSVQGTSPPRRGPPAGQGGSTDSDGAANHAGKGNSGKGHGGSDDDGGGGRGNGHGDGHGDGGHSGHGGGDDDHGGGDNGHGGHGKG